VRPGVSIDYLLYLEDMREACKKLLRYSEGLTQRGLFLYGCPLFRQDIQPNTSMPTIMEARLAATETAMALEKLTSASSPIKTPSTIIIAISKR
jgi:hypothetical protein